MKVAAEIKPILEFLDKFDQIKVIAIYGSFARGMQRTDSDIDLAIAGDRPLDRSFLEQLSPGLLGLTDRRIDLVDLRQVHAPLLQEIFHDCLWFKKDRQIYYEVLKQSLFEAADFLPIRNQILKARIKRFIK